MLGADLLGLEGRGQVEDGLAVLDGDHAPGGERPTVADAVHHVEDGLRGVSGAQKVRVQGVHHSAIDGAARGDQRLTRHLPAEHALAILLRTAAAEDVHLELLEVEDLDEPIDGVRHAPLCHGRATVAPGGPLASRSLRGEIRTCAPPSCERSQLVVDTLPDPEPATGEMLVRTLACGICGSDLHALTHAHKVVEAARESDAPFAMDLGRDVVMGHEFCAEVIDYGPDTTGAARPGDRVVSMPLLFRGAGIQGIGYSNDVPGGYGELMVLSAALALPVPNGLSTEHAALTEPMAVGMHAVEKARLEPHDAALVVGCGPVGLAVIAALKLKGVEPIVAGDFSPMRRALAERMGAHAVVDPRAAPDHRGLPRGRRPPAGGRLRVRRCPGHAARHHAAGAARRAHRGGRGLHGRRHHPADPRHQQGAQPPVRAGLHARSSSRTRWRRSPTAASTWRRW